MKQIFLVEDDKEIAKNLIRLLRTEGFAVTSACSVPWGCPIVLLIK